MLSDQEFLLYPLDTGEDPACLDCGTLMMVAGHEVREAKPSLTSSLSDAKGAGGPKSLSAMSEALQARRFAGSPASFSLGCSGGKCRGNDCRNVSFGLTAACPDRLLAMARSLEEDYCERNGWNGY